MRSITQIQIYQMKIQLEIIFKCNCHLLHLKSSYQKRSIKASLKRSGKFKYEQRHWLFQITDFHFSQNSFQNALCSMKQIV